jgi:hypothetical protein
MLSLFSGIGRAGRFLLHHSQVPCLILFDAKYLIYWWIFSIKTGCATAEVWNSGMAREKRAEVRARLPLRQAVDKMPGLHCHIMALTACG